MVRESTHERNEKEPTLAAPAIELLLDPEKAPGAWPEEVARNKEFIAQIENRRKFNHDLDAVIAALPRPDMSLEDAIARERITEEQAAELYTSLNRLIADPDYTRLILYLPFEFLPDARWQPASPDLADAITGFKSEYIKAWDALLDVQDVRANFVDGNVLEVQSRTQDLPRVVKAAHLIPKLVQLGILSIDDVIGRIQASTDFTYRQSMADALAVLADMGFIEHADQTEHPTETEEPDNITDKRKQWLKKRDELKDMEIAGDSIAHAIANDAPIPETTDRQILINGIRKAIESADEAQRTIIYTRYEALLQSWWQQNTNTEVHDELAKTFCHFHGLGLIDDTSLAALDIVIPELAGPFSKNITEMKEEIIKLKSIVAAIETDPELSRYLYPVTLLFGSRLKGYGKPDADIDIAVMVRPDVAPEEQGRLHASLEQVLARANISGRPVEFWLQETINGLAVRDFEATDAARAGSSWTHILFGAVWEGDPVAMQELRAKLLVPYFYDSKKLLYGRPARKLYLEELERDTLQYRLMHNGYERYFSAVGGINTPHSDRIDSRSMFWDSGYRQIATKLFGNQVFLPKLSPKM